MNFVLKVFATRTAVLAAVTLVAAVVAAVLNTPPLTEARVSDITDLAVLTLAAVSSGVTLTKLYALFPKVVEIFSDVTDGDPNT